MGTSQEERTGPPGTRFALPSRAPGLRRPVAAGAVLLIAASLVLHVLVLKDSYFVEDDLLFVGNAYQSGLTPDFLLRVHNGHFMPGAFALTWVLSHASAYDWTLVASVTTAAQALLSVAAFRLLGLLFGYRPMILLPLTVFLFSPLTIPGFGWWAAAINAVPLQLAMVLALTAQVRFARGEGDRYGRRALGWWLMGMAFSIKGVFVAFVLFAVTTAFLRDRQIGWIRSMLRELGRHRRLWGAYAAIMGGYTALYLARRSAAPVEGAVLPQTGHALEMVGTMVGRTFPSGAVGGPLGWLSNGVTGGLAAPSDTLVAISWVVVAAVVVTTVVHRRRAVRAWVLLGGYLLFADAVPAVIARSGSVAASGAEPRYVADAVVVLMLCLGFALLPLAGERDAYRRPLPGGSLRALTAGLAAGAYLVVSVISIEDYRSGLSVDRIRGYFDTVRAELAAAPDDTVIYPTPVPDHVMVPWFGDGRLSSRVLTPLARPALRARMTHPEPSHEAKVFDQEGRLVEMGVFGFFEPLPPGGFCLPVTDGAVLVPEAVSAGGPVTAGSLFYSAARSASVTLEVGRERLVLNLRATPGDTIYFPMRTAGRGVRIVIDDPGAQVCLKGLAIGAPAAPPP
ncbi:hypothetical protein ACFOWE_07450 [Planomonospora corallina]|uniref:Uncharacterized protein n=1 Tax=Planomonospora corallina TaxID=1806052 RepID=A0ABV8I897_9ACTN